MTSNDKAREQERGQILPARHGRRDEALEKLLLARFDDGKAEAPDGGSHQVHAQQAGDDEVDVAGAGFVNRADCWRGDGVVAAGGGLDGAVGEQAGDARVGIGVVVFVGDAAVASESRAAGSAGGERVRAGGFVHGTVAREALVGGQRLRRAAAWWRPTGSTSAGRLRKAMPRPTASRMGKTKIQKRASGSRRKRRKRALVSW